MKRPLLTMSALLSFAVAGSAQYAGLYSPQASGNSVTKHEKHEKKELKQHQKSERAACRDGNGAWIDCANLKSHEKAEKSELKAHQRSEHRHFRR